MDTPVGAAVVGGHGLDRQKREEEGELDEPKLPENPFCRFRFFSSLTRQVSATLGYVGEKREMAADMTWRKNEIFEGRGRRRSRVAKLLEMQRPKYILEVYPKQVLNLVT